MNNFELSNGELPFSSLNGEQFFSVLNPHYNYDSFKNLEYIPLTVEHDRYNRDIDADEFYISRSITIPKTVYFYLDHIPMFNTNDLTISNMNIRSIPKNINSFKDTVMHTNINFHVIGLTEIRLAPHLTSLYELPGYRMYANTRNVHGGGVAIYILNHYVSSIQKM